MSQKVLSHGLDRELPFLKSLDPIQVSQNKTNLTTRGLKRFLQKIELPPVGIELTTDHHWFRSLIQLYKPAMYLGKICKLNIVPCISSYFRLRSFLDSIEHDVKRI